MSDGLACVVSADHTATGTRRHARRKQVGHNIMLRQTISFRFPFPLKDSITKRVPYLSERPAPVANRPHSNSLMIEHLLLALALSSE
jgi:hypothetical protein